jgi:hypothetical protein
LTLQYETVAAEQCSRCISTNVNDNVSDRRMYMHTHTHTAERQPALYRQLYTLVKHFVTGSVCCRLLFRTPSMLQQLSSTHSPFAEHRQSLSQNNGKEDYTRSSQCFTNMCNCLGINRSCADCTSCLCVESNDLQQHISMIASRLHRWTVAVRAMCDLHANVCAAVIPEAWCVCHTERVYAPAIYHVLIESDYVHW